jgi:hypothetical protein
MDIRSIPVVLQYNKRDFPDVYSVDELEEKLNKHKAPYFEAVAVTGEGVFPTLKKLSQMVLESLNRQQSSSAVKVPKRKVEAKEPVAVGAGKKVAAEATSAGRAAASSASAGNAPARRETAPRAPAPTLIKEAISSSPGIKPIERRSLSPDKGIRKRGSGEVSAAQAAAPAAGKSKAGLVCALAVATVAIAAAVAYFSGFLNGLLGK